MKIVGIDPGKSGGLSLVEGGQLIEVIPMPTYKTPTSKKGKFKEMVNFSLVAQFIKKHSPQVVYIEAVAAMPKQGVSSMFSFGWSTGGLHGVCAALEIPVKVVQPRTWQKELMGDDTHEKDDTIKFVSEKWPNISLLATKRSKVPHDGMADSAAISFYGFKNENGINKEDNQGDSNG